MKKFLLQKHLLLLFTLFSLSRFASAWSEHPMLVYPVYQMMPQLMQASDVEVKSLYRFLIEEENGLVTLLQAQESWAREHIPNYASRPEPLAFQTSEDSTDILYRFFRAIRINPNARVALYKYMLPNQDVAGRETIDHSYLTTLNDYYEPRFNTYLRLHEGEMVAPVDVLASATNEPDYGLDLGLFDDNGTSWGDVYGFGPQPFGNPALEYSSQAPFHMGFYHEGWLILNAAPFLKRTYVEYRIHLYKTLAQYAFSAGQDYWGYRFLGWATHYVNDLSMPYHTSVLPGRGKLGMLWINLKAMLGFPRSRDEAVQLVSNAHSTYERFQWQLTRKAYLENDMDHPFIQALMNPLDALPYDNDFPRQVIARESSGLARKTDRALRRHMPSVLVKEPTVEVVGSPELERVVAFALEEKGPQAVEEMTAIIAERLRAFSMHTRSFTEHVLEPEKAGQVYPL